MSDINSENTLHIDIETRKQFTGDIPEGDEASGIIGAIGSKTEMLSDRKVAFTHDLCYKHLELVEFSGERLLEDKHVSWLISCMKRGTFHPEWVTLISATCDGKDYRMNGQHTSWARLAMPVEWAGAGHVRYQHYSCETIEDMRILYASIDRGRTRTRGMVMQSYLGGTEHFEDFKKSSVKYIGMCLPFWLWEKTSERNKHDADDVAAMMMTEHRDLCCAALKIADELLINGPTMKYMKRAAVGAAILETTSKNL